MTRIYTVIVTYNAMHKSWIDKCLASLQASTVPTTAIVVDNGSTDDTLDFVKSKFPTAVVFPQQKNLGFGQANNIGIKYAMEHEADYILLLNQDATIAPEALEILLKHTDGEALLSPLQLNGEGSALDFMFRSRMRHVENRFFDDATIRGEVNGKYAMQDFPAACWFMPIDIIHKIGGFNPLFFHYGEDDNYLHRVAFHKIPTYIVPQARMYHDRGIHGNIKAFNKNRCHRSIMVAFCNVNLSAAKVVVESLRILTRCYTVDLPCHEYRIGTFTIALAKALAQLPAVIKSRKEEKQPKSNWL